MNLDLLARVVHGRVVGGAAVALARVPAVSDALPDVPVPPGGRPVVLPVAVGGLLAPLVERALRTVVDEAVVDLRPPPPEELARKLESDPLTRTVVRLLGEAICLSPGAASAVALEVVRSSAAGLAQPGSHVADAVRKLNELPAPRRSLARVRVAEGMAARLGAAIQEVARGGQRVPALASALTAARLAWVLPFRAPPPLDLGLACAAAGVEPAPELLEGATIAGDLVLGQLITRAQARALAPADALLAQRYPLYDLAADPQGADRLAVDPDVWALVLPHLGAWLDRAALEGAGVERAVADELLRPDVALGVSTLVGRALRDWQAWQVHAALLAALGPPLEGSVEARYLYPRASAASGTVVAVAVGAASAETAEASALPRQAGELVASFRARLGSSALVQDLGPVEDSDGK